MTEILINLENRFVKKVKTIVMDDTVNDKDEHTTPSQYKLFFSTIFCELTNEDFDERVKKVATHNNLLRSCQWVMNPYY